MTFRSKYNEFSVTKENKEVRMFLLCSGFLLVFVSTTDLQKLISRITTCATKEMQHYKILSATEGMCDDVSNRSIMHFCFTFIFGPNILIIILHWYTVYVEYLDNFNRNKLKLFLTWALQISSLKSFSDEYIINILL